MEGEGSPSLCVGLTEGKEASSAPLHHHPFCRLNPLKIVLVRMVSSPSPHALSHRRPLPTCRKKRTRRLQRKRRKMRQRSK